jgi:hypothetical protein
MNTGSKGQGFFSGTAQSRPLPYNNPHPYMFKNVNISE